MDRPTYPTLEHTLRTTRELQGGTVVAERFEVVRRIGKGGSGSVYLCKDRKLARLEVALKVIDPDFLIKTGRSKRIELEILAAHRVDSNHVARIYEVILDKNLVAYTAEYVRGLDLRQYLHTEGSLPLSTVKHIMLQASAGLKAIHSQNILHRDLKPENIIITEDAFIKIVDFGIARILEDNITRATQSGAFQTKENGDPTIPKERITAHGSIVGTLEFMAPEYILHGEADYRADLYSLGVTCLELLTGKNPYQGLSESEVIKLKIEDSEHLYLCFPEELPRDWREALRSLICENPEQRYPNVESWIQSLRGLSTGAKNSSVSSSEQSLVEPLPISKRVKALVKRDVQTPSIEKPSEIGNTLRKPIVGRAGSFRGLSSRDLQTVTSLLRLLVGVVVVLGVLAIIRYEFLKRQHSETNHLPPRMNAGRSINPAPEHKSSVRIIGKGNDVVIEGEGFKSQTSRK